MKTTNVITLLFLSSTSAIAAKIPINDNEATTAYFNDHLKRQDNKVCPPTDCTENGDAQCTSSGCKSHCDITSRCIPTTKTLNPQVLPKIQDVNISSTSGPLLNKPALLPTFLEATHLKDHWAPHICDAIVAVSPDSKTPGKWHYSIQGTRKTGSSLSRTGEYLTVLATWEVKDKNANARYGRKALAQLCMRGMESVVKNTAEVRFGEGDREVVGALMSSNNFTVGNVREKLPSRKAKKDVAKVRLELGEYERGVPLFKGSGLA